MARKHDDWLIAGSIFEKGEDGKDCKISSVILPDGEESYVHEAEEV